MMQTYLNLVAETRRCAISCQQKSPHLLVQWSLPANMSAIGGYLIFVGKSDLPLSIALEDGKRYSHDPVIGGTGYTNAGFTLVHSAYGFYGDEVSSGSVLVSNVDLTAVYTAVFVAMDGSLLYSKSFVSSSVLQQQDIGAMSGTFTGIIPQSVVLPDNPYDGQPVYNPTTGILNIWSEADGAWVVSEQAPPLTGDDFPVDVGQLFVHNKERKLFYSNGAEWVECTSANTQVRVAGQYVPLTGVVFSKSGGPGTLWCSKDGKTGDYIVRCNSNGAWLGVGKGFVRVEVGGQFVPAEAGFLCFGDDLPEPVAIGSLFYKIKERALYVRTSSGWVRADTDQIGVPQADKVGIGTDGRDVERYALKEVLRHQLGHPAVCVELNDTHIDIAISNALDTARQLISSAFTEAYIPYKLKAGQNRFLLNDQRDDTHRVFNVKAIHTPNLGYAGQQDTIGWYAMSQMVGSMTGGQGASTGFGSGGAGSFDTLGYHLSLAAMRDLKQLTGGSLRFSWNTTSRLLQVYKPIHSDMVVLLEVDLFRTDQELMQDVFMKQWIQEWAMSECYETLGNIRGKYSSLPGPNGVNMNGQECSQKATELQTQLRAMAANNEGGGASCLPFYVF